MNDVISLLVDPSDPLVRRVPSWILACPVDLRLIRWVVLLCPDPVLSIRLVNLPVLILSRPIRVSVPLSWVVSDRLDRETDDLLIVVILRVKALLRPAMVCGVPLEVMRCRVLLVVLVVVILVSSSRMACM